MVDVRGACPSCAPSRALLRRCERQLHTHAAMLAGAVRSRVAATDEARARAKVSAVVEFLSGLLRGGLPGGKHPARADVPGAGAVTRATRRHERALVWFR